MNKLEINLLFSLDFSLQVNMGTFGRYCLQLEKEATGHHVERPIQVCARKEWTNVEDSKCQPALQRSSCGAVWGSIVHILHIVEIHNQTRYFVFVFVFLPFSFLLSPVFISAVSCPDFNCRLHAFTCSCRRSKKNSNYLTCVQIRW